MAIIFQWIPVMMFGIEFPPKMLVVDLAIIRVMLIWGITQEEIKEMNLD
jgi:hypothetical protein